jgi:hypothetical protein
MGWQDAVVTQTLTLINEHGAWQSADFRLTADDLSVINDFSAKQIRFWCDDGTALVCYAGLGSVFPRGTRGPEIQISDWMRTLLRGERLTLRALLERIRDAATRDLGPLLHQKNWQHLFSVALFYGASPGLAEIRNFSVTSPEKSPTLLDHFVVAIQELRPPLNATASWPRLPRESEDVKLLCEVHARPSPDPKEAMRVLAEVNKRVSEANSTVSPHCVVTYMPPGRKSGFTEVFWLPEGAPNLALPSVVDGIDLTDMHKHLMESLRALKEGKPDPPMVTPDLAPKNLFK